MLFLSSHCSSVTTRCGMRRFLLTSGDAGHDQPFPDFLLCFFQMCCTRSTSCVVSTRSRKVISASESDASCGRECVLSPASVKCGHWYVSKHTGHRRGRDQQFVVAVQDFSR